MILMKEYVFLTIAAMKMGKRLKDGSLGNSMLNHPGHGTLPSWIFEKCLPVVGIIEI